MSLGLIALGVIAGLVYFGLAQRVLDRMRLTDTQALLFIALMILGSFLTVTLVRGRVDVTVNVGGALVPLALVIYLLTQAGTNRERWRAVLGAVGTGAVIWALVRYTDFGPHGGVSPVIDPLWLFAIVAGVLAYLLGRSRRAAFIAAALGTILADVAGAVTAWQAGELAVFPIGGGGVFDAIVISGVVAVGLAELVGEVREGLQGGPGDDHPAALQKELQGPGGPYEEESQWEGDGDGAPVNGEFGEDAVSASGRDGGDDQQGGEEDHRG